MPPPVRVPSGAAGTPRHHRHSETDSPNQNEARSPHQPGWTCLRIPHPQITPSAGPGRSRGDVVDVKVK